MNTSASCSEINFFGGNIRVPCRAYLSTKVKATHSWFLFRKKESKQQQQQKKDKNINNAYTYIRMSCLHHLTPGCSSGKKIIKRYLNLNSKKSVSSIILISEESSDNSFKPGIRAVLQFQGVEL